MKIVAFTILFLLFGAFFIVSNENLALKDSDKRGIFIRHYYGWFVNIFSNTKSLTGNVIHSNWLPDLSLSKNNSKKVQINSTLNSTINSTSIRPPKMS